MITMIISFIVMVAYVMLGYAGMDKWFAGSGVAICAIIGLMSLLHDIKNEIVKAIREGVKTDELSNTQPLSR
jgi:hypothetical protein